MNHVFRFFIVIIIILAAFIIVNYHKDTPISDTTYTYTTDYSTYSLEPASGETEEEYVDNNPIKIGFYLTDSSRGKRTLVKDFTGKWEYHTDIEVFNTIYTQNEEIETTRIGECFEKYMKEYESGEDYHVGFHISFETEDGNFSKTILTPKDVEEFYEYLEIYLYDGYHRKAGEWYSHTTEEEYNDSTRYTAIKLTAGVNVKKITSPLTLTTFTYYDMNDFDENGDYRGISKYTITVNKS